jgi:hypothetical protein
VSLLLAYLYHRQARDSRGEAAEPG